MKIYLVGGAVRDKLLHIPIKEKDWVVVGAQPAELLRLGYKQVGKEFPVFLHPQTAEEYALARKERKVAPGYTGFEFDTSPQVTLEEDLLRRDLTINAMAETVAGELIDPYQGQADLKSRILRHVSPAFSEDPVRILRLARFAARYAPLGFNVAPETLAIAKKMVTAGEVDALVPERVWKELERALGEKSPAVFFQVLADCAALSLLFPELALDGPGIAALKQTVNLTADTQIRFGALMHAASPEAIQALCKRYRLPVDYQEFARLVARYGLQAGEFYRLSAVEILNLFVAVDAFRRSERFTKFLLASQALAYSRKVTFPHEEWEAAYRVTKPVNVKEWLDQPLKGPEIAEKLKEKRLTALATWLEKSRPSS